MDKKLRLSIFWILIILLVQPTISTDFHLGQKHVVQLTDGKKLTGLAIHLPVARIPPVHAYLGIRYASLGGKQTTYFSARSNQRNDDTKHDFVPSPHRFSHSVASFFYESPTGTRSKTVLPPVCPQPPIDLKVVEKEYLGSQRERLKRLAPFLYHQTEDCLTLNIYVPNSVNNVEYTRQPVVLFVHGESYEYGSGNAYDLSVLAGYTGAICITFNYRLGLLGFLSLKDGQSNGNFALFDLQAALLWIRTNIARFRGDPDQLILMGYGHGAALIHLFSLSKLSQGFGGKGIKRIILLNGSGLAAWATSGSEDVVMRELAKQLNITEAQEPESSNKTERQVSLPSTGSSELKQSKEHSYKSLETHGISAILINKTKDSNITTKPNLPSLSQLLVKRLKELSFDNLVRLQKNLSSHPCAAHLGPVISKHLFAEILSGSGSIHVKPSGNSDATSMPNQQNHRRRPRESLFSKVDLMVGYVKQSAGWFYRESNWQGTRSRSLARCLQFVYPQNQQAISDVLQYLYKQTLVEKASTSNSILLQPDRFIEQTLTILSDGFYKAPAFQTASLHRKLLDLGSADSNSTGSRRTFLASFQHQSARTSRFQVLPKASELPSEQAWYSPGFGDDLAYVFGAPLVSPNRLDPFDGTYSRYDATISRELLNYISSFINTGDPNQSVRGDSSKNASTYWPEYDDRRKAYLNIGALTSRSALTSSETPFTIGHGSQDNRLSIWSELLPRIAGLPSKPMLKDPTQKHNESSTVTENQRQVALGPERKSKNAEAFHREFDRWLPNPGSIQSYLYFFHLRDRQRACAELCVPPNASATPSEKVFQPDHLREQEYIERPIDRPLSPSTFDDYVLPTFEDKPLFHLPRAEAEFQMPAAVGQPQIQAGQSRRIEFNPTTRTALLWTIATGLTLFLLNALVFIGIYCQAHRMRSEHAIFENVPTITVQSKTLGKPAKPITETLSRKAIVATSSNTGCVPSKKSRKTRHTRKTRQIQTGHEAENCEHQVACDFPTMPFSNQPPRPMDPSTLSQIQQPHEAQLQHPFIQENIDYRQWHSSKPSPQLGANCRVQLPSQTDEQGQYVSSNEAGGPQAYFGPYCAY